MSESINRLIFETDRLIVRPFTTEDKNNFFLINGDEEVMRYIRAAKTREECDKFLEEIIAGYTGGPEMGRWAVEERATGVFVGSFVIIPIPDMPEKIQLGYALLKDFWGKGYATELTQAGVSFAFYELGLEVIFGVTEIPNIASQKILLKAGFIADETYIEGEKELVRFVFLKENFNQNFAITPV
jgi:ribosomal-protein-alanine N-acetyltransferase